MEKRLNVMWCGLPWLESTNTSDKIPCNQHMFVCCVPTIATRLYRTNPLAVSQNSDAPTAETRWWHSGS